MIRLFTMIELERLTNTQLEELRMALHHLLALSKAGSADRSNILASLENVNRTIQGSSCFTVSRQP